MILQFKTKNKKQLRATEAWLNDDVEEILFGGAKAGGKSFLGAVLIFGDALIYPETHYFIARKELNDLRKFTIPTIHEVFKIFELDINKYANFNGQDNCFNLTNGSKVYLIACKEEPSDPLFERFGSMQMTRGWIEEAGEIEEDAKANLWLSVGRWKNDVYKLKKKLLITANPKKGWLKREFIDPKELPKEKVYIQSFATDNPYLSKDYLKSLSSEKNKIRRQRLWEGRWDYDEDAGSLVSYDALSDMFSNTIVKDGQKYLTVDIARYGRDKTIFNFWDGWESYRRDIYSEQGLDTTIQKIRDFASIEKIPYSHILVDENGVGGGVVDALKGIKGFVGHSSPLATKSLIRKQSQYLLTKPLDANTIRAFNHIKSQCAFKLAEMIATHRVAVKGEGRDEIIEDLTAVLVQRDADKDGKLQIIKKEDIKQVLGRSSDIGDTFIMRAYFELLKDAGATTEPYQQSIGQLYLNSKRGIMKPINRF